jgi:hypothetical protein
MTKAGKGFYLEKPNQLPFGGVLWLRKPFKPGSLLTQSNVSKIEIFKQIVALSENNVNKKNPRFRA